MKTTTYDRIIAEATEKHFPALVGQLHKQAWLLIKAQIYQESRFDPKAVSPAGAMGLMQIMPITAVELELDDPFDPEENVSAGVRYLAIQYEHFPEIPGFSDRISASLASYNGGRGYVNKALELGRVQCSEPASYLEWWNRGGLPGAWQLWPVIARNLERVEYRGWTPDYKQMQNYVTRILKYFADSCVHEEN